MVSVAKIANGMNRTSRMFASMVSLITGQILQITILFVISGKWKMDRKDDAGKFLDAMKSLLQQEQKNMQENMQNDMDKLGKNVRMMYLGFIHAGFTTKQAMELTKETLSTGISNAFRIQK